MSERQKTVGVGSPSPTHSMLTRSPTMAVILSPGVMVTVGGPVGEDEKQYYGESEHSKAAELSFPWRE